MSSLFPFLLLLLLPLLLPNSQAQKCFPHTPSPPPPSPPPASAAPLLLPPTFFSTIFQKHPHLLPYSSHPSRILWLRTYRTFLPHNDLDALLQHNTSYNLGPLRLNKDVTLVHPSSNTHLNYFHKHSPEFFSLQNLHQAVRDRFTLILHHVHMRTESLANFCESLRRFFTVPVQAHLHFVPPTTPGDITRPTMYADDVFLVILEGHMSANLYERMFAYPAPRHLQYESVLNSAYETASETTPQKYALSEGDILYLPPGCGIHVYTNQSMALYVQIHIGTHESTVDQGIIATISAARGNGQSPLEQRLVQADEHVQATWADLLKSCVRIAAEFTPELRRFLPLGEQVSEMVEDEVGEGVFVMLRDEVDNFIAAAEGALLQPVVEVLKSGEEGVKSVASEELVHWAGNVNVREVEVMWRKCIQWVAEREEAVYDGLAVLQLDHLEREKVETVRRLKHRDAVLAKHGVKMGQQDATATS